jgi:hypothetical protein
LVDLRSLKYGSTSRKTIKEAAQILCGLGAETFMFDPTGLPWAGAKEMMRITEPKTSLFTSKPSDFAPP